MDPAILQDPVMVQNLTSLGVSLATLAAKGTASTVTAKVAAIKEIKSVEKVRNAYEELISELLDERSEAIRIAQAYKDELDRVQISDEDIESLNSTIGRLLDVFGVTSIDDGVGGNAEAISQRHAIEQMRHLISSDTLRTMQLLGFNYKAAIGEPLTELCAAKIRELGAKGRQSGTNKGNRHNR